MVPLPSSGEPGIVQFLNSKLRLNGSSEVCWQLMDDAVRYVLSAYY
jgi:hypothetical protein